MVARPSGMGCPDWPTCWGCLIHPPSAEQIDTSKLDIGKYRRRAARHGIDPETITEESVINEFNSLMKLLTIALLSLLVCSAWVTPAKARRRHQRVDTIAGHTALSKSDTMEIEIAQGEALPVDDSNTVDAAEARIL